METAEETTTDICRVCRSEASPDKPLFHPCVCTGSIRYIHQECLLQWLKYSKKEYCELCKHRFAFTPIYSPDMPKRLPVKVLLGGLLKSIGHAVRYWLHYSLVIIAWLGVVPIATYRIYRCLFTGTWSSILTLPLDVFSMENMLQDCFQGCYVVACTLIAFLSLVWLREQIQHGGGPEWLDFDLGGNAQNNAGGVGGGDGAEAAGDNEEGGGNQGNQPAGGAPPPAAGAAAGEQGAHPQPQQQQQQQQPQNNQQPQDDHWNPMDWDRAGDELTWERLLGLDGSLVFLEHVFWVVSLNTIFILLFAFCPYYLGSFMLQSFNITNLESTKFEGILTTLVGYVTIASTLILLHSLFSVVAIKWWVRRSHRVLGVCYVVVKVVLLVVVEIGIFPLICGWWLDICTLSMFDATIRDRENSFKLAPSTSMFIHWLVGMVYVFYFASFILLLREVLRPGALWFLRNLNEPDFNPIQEMIHLPVYRHIRRFLISMVIFGTTALVMLWLPIKFIRICFSGFLPYNVMLSSDSPMSELSLELLLLQVVLPALLEQGHTRLWLKNLVRYWCIAVSMLLDLRSYLLGDEPLRREESGGNNDNAANQNVGNDPQQQQQQQQQPAAPLVVGDNDNAEGEVAENDGNDDNNGDGGDEPENGSGSDGEGEQLNINVVHRHRRLDEIRRPRLADIAPQIAGPAGAAPLQPGAPPPVGGAAVAGPALPPPEAQPQLAGGAGAVALPGGVGVGPGIPVGAPAVPAGGDGGAAGEGLAAAHHAMLHRGGPTGYQPYRKPAMFPLKLVCLCILICVTLFLASLITLILPVYIGRMLMSIWMGESRVHELYTAACGLYTCWVVMRAATVVYNWVPQGWAVIMGRVKEWTLLALKALLIAVLMLGVAPLLLGVLFELVIVAPIRVPLDQTPIFFPWQDWALGVLHAKIICATSMMGPQWWLRRVMEQVYNQGLRNMDLVFILTRLCFPVISILALTLALPYIVARSIVPALGCTFETQNLVLRRIYPFLLSTICFVAFIIFQAKQFKRLYEHIKNDRYLVGQKLVNYDRSCEQADHAVTQGGAPLAIENGPAR